LKYSGPEDEEDEEEDFVELSEEHDWVESDPFSPNDDEGGEPVG